MDDSLNGILLDVSAFLLFLYYYLTKNFDFWERRGIAGPKPIPFFGNYKDVFFGNVHAADFVHNLCKTYSKEPAVGIFFRRSPVLIVKDLEMINEVFIKNFSNFADRGVKIHTDIDPLSQHLVYLEHKRWKIWRKKLSPVFTSGKLKESFYLINECAENLNQYLGKLVSKNETIECRDLCAKFTTDVIGVFAFGLNMNSLSDEEGEFRKIGRSLYDDNLHYRFRHYIRSLPYGIARLVKGFARNDYSIDFLVNTFKTNMEYRRENKILRHDCMDTLIDIKDHPEQMGDEEVTDILLTAQAYVFFVGGFETSSGTMSHALYELALNPDIQKKLREEIIEIYKWNHGKLNYDCIKDMKYLDKVLKESLRKYPIGFELTRVATNNHTFANSKISTSKGMRILLPIYSVHHNQDIYPEPDRFDPERFNEEVVSTRPPMSYLPFGDGPRNCIGERSAMNQVKLGIAAVIRHFKFEVCERTCIPYVKSKNFKILAPQGGLYLKISKI